jgi:hypothetical protein
MVRTSSAVILNTRATYVRVKTIDVVGSIRLKFSQSSQTTTQHSNEDHIF